MRSYLVFFLNVRGGEVFGFIGNVCFFLKIFRFRLEKL